MVAHAVARARLRGRPGFAAALAAGFAASVLGAVVVDGTPAPVRPADALGSGALVRIVDRHVDVPLYWQYWKLSSPLVDSLTQMTLAAAREYLV